MEVLVRLRENLLPFEQSIQAEELTESDVDGEEDEYLQNAASNRTYTDVPFLFVQAGFIFILMFFLAYCIVYGDIDRLFKGYDTCGNVCGKLNDFDIQSQSDCRPMDMTMKPYLSNGQCAARCTDQQIFLGYQCRNQDNPFEKMSQQADHDFENFLNSVARDFHTCAREIVYLCFIALSFAFIILLVLRYMAAAFVWSVLIGVVMACAAATAFFWHLTDQTEEVLPIAIIFSILTLVVILIILVLRKRIQLVIQLLKEAGKSITAVPLLLLEPILTFISLAALWSVFVYFALWIESAGIPTEQFGYVRFRQNAAMRFTRWYNLFVMLWMVQFVYGCQNMLIAGAVSTWYFTRNKNKLGRPIYNSFSNMLKYHLGTISIGSLIVALIQIIRTLFRSLRKTLKCIKCCMCLCCIHTYIESGCEYLEHWMKYFSRNAYIITAIHGYPFYESGTRAFKLLVENALRVLTINSVGDFVLVLAKVLVVASTVLVGQVMIQDKEHIDNKWAPLVLVGLVAYLIAHCFITVYEMAIDTIFICFCEDCEINDGLSKPYYMSHDLMAFVEKSKSVLGIQIAQEAANVNPVLVTAVHYR